MGTIISRARKDGSQAHTAQIRIMRNGRTIYSEAKTFDRKQAAQAWMKRREVDLSQPGALEQREDPAFRDAIDRYLAESRRAVGRSKAQALRTVKADPIASLRCSEVTTEALLAFCGRLTCQPQTIAGYLSHLSAIFAIARPAWSYPLNQQAIKDAFAIGKRLGLTAKSKSRDRRPTLDELDLLMRHFERVRRRRPASVPMQAIIAFAIYSTRRMDEILRITWADLDHDHGRVLVRDMKHPEQKDGNDQWLDLPAEAMSIAMAQPRTSDRIFPYGTDAVGAAFTRACKVLGINDLRFHDLRHAGVSRLFEMGMTIPHVAAVSGHRGWTNLQRYTHIRQKGDCMSGWPWLDVLTKKTPP